MKKKITMLILTAMIITAIPTAVNAASISPAIEILSAKSESVKAGLYNCDVVFTKTDFLQNLGISDIDGITFTSVPPSEDGYLFIGNTTLSEGMTVTSDVLSHLRFRAASSEIDTTTFTYRLSERQGGTEHNCKIVFLDNINAAPTAAVPVNAPSYETYRNVPLYSRLSASDPENDAISYRITKQPKHGTLTLINGEYGEFCYTPKKNYTGKDSFSYVVCDKYGNFSDVEKVTVKTLKNKTKTVLADMTDNKNEYAAIAVCADGLMQSVTVGKNEYFDPEGTVTRAEMLAMLMQAAGIEANEISTDKFADFESVPQKYKAYVATAARMGIINGINENGVTVFNPNGNVTRAEAAVMASALIGSDDEAIQTFADYNACPDWCGPAVNFAIGNNLLTLKNGYADPSGLLLRGDCAVMLNSLMKMK